MKTEWDYTELAQAYLKRPDYSEQVIDKIISNANLKSKDRVCDIGAGVGHLTLMLARRNLDVTAVEPNDKMRELGSKRCSELKNVRWYEGTGENTAQDKDLFCLTTFGSSFNVVDRSKALKECHRILKPAGWFACMWNHRDLEDPIQSEIENIIKKWVPNYSYGARRENQTEILESSGMLQDIEYLEGAVTHQQSIDDCVEAWKSHATLQRQAGSEFSRIVRDIEDYLCSLNKSTVNIPYVTRAWVARFSD